MMTQRFGAVIKGVLCVALAWIGGCQAPKGFPEEAGRAAQVMAEMVRDQGVMDKFTSNLDANVQDPGLESYVKVTTAAGVRLVGVNGEIDLLTQGTGTQLPQGVRDSLVQQLDAPISDEQRQYILGVLGWNRVVSPHNPVPNAGGG